MVSQSALLLVLLAVATCSGVVQGITNEGNEFFLLVPPVKSQARNQFIPQLHITTSEDTNVMFTVSHNAASHRLSAFNQTFTASKGSVTKVDLPTGLRAFTTSPANLDIAVNVKADGNKTIVVYLLNEDDASTDIALLYPKFATKTNTYTYYAVSSPKADPELGDGERSFVGIIPTEDNCVVEVTPTASAFGFIFGVATRDHRPGVVAKSRALPKNTVIFLSSEDDLTGTKVTGTCYLSVISGHQCAFYPANVRSCDGIMEQIPPTETWGFNFFLSPLAKRQSAGYRFIAGADNTVVTRRCNGSEPDTFNLTLAGNFREVLVNMPTYCHVESNQPLLVAQYSLGHEFGGVNDIFSDPFVTLIAPVGQFNYKYNFILVESVTPQDVAQPVVFDPYLNLVITSECCQRNEILYDGQPLPSSVSFTDIACTGGEVCGCAAQFHPSVSTGAHTLMHSRDSCGIGATLYAWQDQNSYGSMAGTRLDSIAATMYCLKESSLTVTEGAGVVEFTATRTGTEGQPDCINVTVVDISTQGSSDVEPPSECCFAADEREATCTVTIVRDSIPESDEMFNIRLNPRSDQCVCNPPDGPNLKVTIVEGGVQAITIDFDPVVYNVSEDSGSAIVFLKASSPASSEYSVTVTTQDGTAIAGQDYTGGSYTATFLAGETTASVSIPITDDTTAELTEDFSAVLTIPATAQGITKGADDTATIRLTDNDAVEVVFNPTQKTVNEDNGTVTLTLNADKPASFDYTVEVETQDGTATAGQDYTGGSYTATFLAGQTTASVSIPIIDNTTAEPTEDFTAVLTIPATAASQGITKGAADTATIDILDDDTVEVVFNPTQYSVNEGDGVVILILIANNPASFNYTVEVETQNGTATGGLDFDSEGYQAIFLAGETTVFVFCPIIVDITAEPTENFSAVLNIPATAASQGITKGAADTATIDIVDDDTVEVVFNPTQYTVNEGDGVVTLTLNADKPASFEYTVEVVTQDGTATAPLDYQPGPYSVTFPAGSTTVAVNITIESDSVLEGTESFTATISTANTGFPSVTAGDDDTATINIQEDASIQVNLNPTQYSVSEDAENVVLTLLANQPASFDYTVQVDTVDGATVGGPGSGSEVDPVDGAAVAGQDYTGGSYNATFLAGQTTASVSIPIIDDTIAEITEDFSAVLTIPATAASQGITKGAADTATIDILDDDTVEVVFNPTQKTVNEDNGTVILTLNADKPASFDYTVQVVTQDGTATAGQDYTGGSYTATFLAGQTTASVSIPITNDTTAELTETFSAVLSIPATASSQGITKGAADTATIEILDDDTVEVVFNPTQYPVNESDGVVTLTLNADKPASFEYTVEVETQDGTATAGQDYTGGSYTATFLAGQTTASVSIPITNDTTAEPTEDFSAVLTIPATAASQGITKGAADTATISILDEDTVEVVFNPTQYTVNEGDGVVTLTLNADKNASFDYTVQVETQDGTATASSDYQPGPYSVTFPAGSTTAAVNITIESDSILEGTETFTATISTANTGFPSVTAGDDDTATINIQEDASIQVNFSPTEYNVSEDAGNRVLTLLANQPASFDYTVQVDTVDGSAVAGQDYTRGSYTATFLAGQTTASVSIPIIDNTTAEPTEDFTAVLTIPATAASQGITKGAADTATINILDDDTVEVVFNPTQYTVNEGDGVVTLILNADKPASFEYTVQVETQDGTATASSDYQPCNCSVTFPAGSTIAAVNITIYNDAVYEGPDPEAFTATISTANTGVPSISPGDDDTATISINENEALCVEFDPTEYAVSEVDGSAQLVVKASVAASFDYDVVITTSDLSATANDDYSGGPFTVTIPAGQTQVSEQVPILQDVEAEGSEQFQAQLTIPSASADLGVTVCDDDTAVITILDDDGVLVEFSPTRYTVSEGDGVVTLTLTADSVADCNYTVQVRTQDGTATAPLDYLSLPYTATFLAGSTSATVDIQLVEDDIYEANIGVETFTVSISAISAVGCSVSPGPNRTATVSITDNDDLTVQFNPATYDVFESNGSVTLLLETDKQFQYPFTVNVGTADGTAVAPEDYVDGTYNVTFIPELTTAELQVPIVDDTVCEDEEVFFGNIIIPTALVANGVRAGPQNTATITIHDDDVAAVQFDPVQYRVREHDGNAVLQLVSNNTCQFDYNVTVDVSNGTATVGSDFGSGPFTASFSAGSTTSSVNVPITDDQLQEGDETFAAQLQIPSNVPDTVVQGQNTVAQVVIEDNEEVITVNFNPARYEVSEDGLNVELTLVASRPSPVPYSITVNTIDGTAQAFSDYVGGPYVVDFPANETTVRLQIAIMDDTERCECSEDFTASLEVPAAAGQLGVVPGVNDTAEIIIIDDDLCPISFNPEQYSVAENVQGGTVEVCLTVEENCYGDFSVTLQTGNKSAQGPPDYEPGPFTVNFPPNVDRACTNIPIVDDEIFEGDQYFCVSIVVPPDLSLTPGRKANITIVDDDTDVFCSVQQDSITVNEADGIIAVDISISRPVEKPFICEIESQPASAKEGEDFQPIIRNITFLPQESTTREVQLEIVNDDREEGNENLIIFVKDVRGQQVSPVPINVTIIDDEAQGTGDPMFTVPLSLSEETVEKFGQMSICYEVHGKPNKTFNLLSDICVSVNAFYSPAKDQKIGNIMSKIGVLTEDSDGVCQRIEVDLEGCASSVNGQKVSEYYQSGVRVIQRRGKRVRIATPNCGDSDVVMWVICEVQMKERMIKFVISRGDSLRPASHGLIGQFWKTEVSAERYHVKPEDKIQPDQNQFAVTLKKASGEQRRFFAHLYGRTWDRKQKPCLYAGSSQGGRTMEVPSLSGTVIEGRYTHYIVDELMDPKFKYSQFKSQCPTKAWAH